MIFFKFIRTIKLLSLILLCITEIFAIKPDVPKENKINLNTSAFNLVDSNGTFDGNQIYLDLANNGFLVDYHISGDSGLEWPKRTGAHSIFQSSLWMAAKVNGQIRTIVGDYTQDMGPGPWGGDPLAAVHRIYKIDKDMLQNPAGHIDFQEWPIQFGAPWVDVDGDGVYSPLPNGPDHPEFLGDQVLWFVSNDGDPAYKLNFRTSPLNVEMQTTIYGFNRPDINNEWINGARDPLGDAVFYRILVINKGTDDLIGTYMGLWVDPDLGYAGDDLVGSDVELGMGYVWNDGTDSTYESLDIGTPAAGYDLFQGPMVACLSNGNVSFNLDASDANGDVIEFELLSQPGNGSLTFNASTGYCTYSPNQNFTGKDSFIFRAYEKDNPSNVSNAATVTINVTNSNNLSQSSFDSASQDFDKSDNTFQNLNPPVSMEKLVSSMKNLDLSDLQNQDGWIRCASDEFESDLQIFAPDFIKKRDLAIAQSRVMLQENPQWRTSRSTIYIPVIFHVLYFDESDNLAKDKIAANFDQINLDFQNLNPDGDEIPSNPNPSDTPYDPGIDYAFNDVRGSMQVQFVGAQGETNGSELIEGVSIRRYNISSSSVSGVAQASSLANATSTDSGAPSGYQDGYLNIYIAPLGGNLLGQAYIGFPESVVITESVGSVENPGTASGYNRGRTLTHELGHNFTFGHTFSASNCGTPIWNDIPAQIEKNRAANIYRWPAINGDFYGRSAVNSCINVTGKGDQFMNYMDYANDDQMRMFSEEQALEGYAWAAARNWAEVSVENSLPIANNLSIDSVLTNEDCSEGAHMFGTRHPGMKNLQMSSFAFYINGDATYTDPADEEEAYYALQGLRKDGTRYPTYIAGDLYDQKFVFYGDPNDAAGHSTANPVDGNYAPSADRRFLMSIGPFTMAAGDSQEVVFGTFHAAGGGAKESVAYLKEVDAWIQEAYDDNFNLMEEYNNAKPDIELFAGERSGVVPFTTSFSYNSSSELTYIGWDIDNDGVIDSSSKNPTFTFLQSGTYDIKFFYGNTEYVSENRSGYTLQLQYKSLEITVVDPNEIFISDSSISTVEDTPISQDLEISNPENTEYRLNISQNPIHGSVYFNANKLIYSPKENFYGEDSLKIYASTINSNSNTALISISVSAQDDEPSAIDLVKTIPEDSSTEITLDAYEYDGDSIVFEITSNPLHGSLSDLSDRTVTYTPDDDWYGVDKFYFRAEDAQGRSRIATAVINVTPVNDPPLTVDMSIQSYEDQQTPIVLDISDPENDALELTFTNPNHGSITHEPGTSVIIYSPNENYFGQDSLQFVAQDYEFSSNTSTIAISLNPVNDPPSNFESSGQTLVSSTVDSIKPVASNILFITPENINDSLRFQWNESFDIDGDKVQYQLVGNGDLGFLSTDEWTDELTISLALKDIIAQTDTLSTIQGDWLVRAYDGEFEILSNEGQGQPLALNGSALIPEQFNLNQNFPNPFSNTTTLRYDLKTEMLVQIYIYDLQGRKINTLLDEIQSPGFKTLLWDGKSSEGVDVASGIYFVQMHLKSLLNDEKFIATKKITKIKN